MLPRVIRRWWAVWIGLVASLPAFFVGFANDDFVHRLWLEHGFADYTPPSHALYEFTGTRSRDWLVFHEYVPWFTDPDWSLRFFRPLSSWSLALDHWIFGRSSVAAHLQSLLWFGLMLAVVVKLHRRWLPPPVATLASAMYALGGGFSVSTGWIASRHVLVGGALGALALFWHARWREDGFRAGVWLSPLALLVGLVGSEVTLGAAILVLAYELIERQESPGARVKSVLPCAAVTLGYLALYGGLGYGARGSGAYVSPFGDPLRYAAAACLRVPQLAAELFGALPAMSSAALSAGGELVLAALGVLATLFAGGLGFALRERLGAALSRRLLFLSVGSLVSLVPLAGGFIGGRMLPLASIGAAALLGSLLHELSSLTRSLRSARRAGAYTATAALALPHLGIAPLVRLGIPFVLRDMGHVERAQAAQAELGGCADGATAYLLVGSDPTLTLYLSAALAFYEPERSRRLRGMVPLSMSPRDQRLSRTAPDTFELQSFGQLRPAPFERLFRNRPAQVGERVRTRGLEAQVLRTEGGSAQTVRFRFADGAARACLLQLRDGVPKPIELAVGETLTLPYAPGPSGF